MLLAIDVRNTHTVVGLISGSGDHAKVLQNWRIRTEPEVTADQHVGFLGAAMVCAPKDLLSTGFIQGHVRSNGKKGRRAKLRAAINLG